MGFDARDTIRWSTAMAAAAVAGWIAGRRLDIEAGASAAPAREGLLAFLARLYERIGEHRLTSIAGGVTFFVLLALFPATAALVSIYGLFADASALSDQLTAMSDLLPQGAIDIIGGQLERLIAQQSSALGFAFLAGVALSLWSANAGMKALFDALNIIHDETEKRGFIRLNAISLVFTLGLILFFVVAVGAIVVLPAVLTRLGMDNSTQGTLLTLARWPMLFLAISLLLSLIYRFGPSCNEARWRPISPGSAAAAAGWIIASMAFSWYAANFGNFNKTYGTLGAAIGFMTWNWIVTIVILMGAEIDAARDHKATTPLGGVPRRAAAP
jgi:membrane protein